MSIKTLIKIIIAAVSAGITSAAYATIEIDMYSVDNTQPQLLGTVIAEDSEYGLLLTPNLAGLTPGLHGFHFHENPSCADNAMAAGGHLDPANTGKHFGPYNNEGHLGDLPPLYVANDGTATLPVLAPRLTEADITNTALMIHAGGENFSDHPEPLGGGGARMVCGTL